MAETYGIAWEYENHDTTPYYYVEAKTGPLALAMSPIMIEVPETGENTLDIQILVEALRRIAARLTA